MDAPSPKDLVRAGYDRISRAYRADSIPRDREYFRWLAEVVALFRPGGAVLDLGCGCGVPVAQELAPRFRVTGVDISEVQIDRARGLVPDATFVVGDMTAVEFPASSFTAIVSLFAIIHVPRPEHAPLLRRCFDWLEPGGHLLASVGRDVFEGTENDFHGAPMYWSHADDATSIGWMRDAGFDIVWTRFLPELPGAGHTVVLARRNAAAAPR